MSYNLVCCNQIVAPSIRNAFNVISTIIKRNDIDCVNDLPIFVKIDVFLSE